MKVEVITLHRVTNFGSLLQTYATQESLRRLGYDVEVIDFVPEGLSFFRAVWPKGSSTVKKLIKFVPLVVCNLVQFSMVEAFLRKYICLSPERYSSYERMAASCPEADIYLSGSDQIWNTQNQNPPADLGAYYLAFAKDGKRVAYAGSFGKDSFSEPERAQIITWLKQYSALSVREDTAVDMLKSLGFSGTHVVDPTLLLTGDCWRRLCKKKKPMPGYVFVYNLNRNKILEKAALEIAKTRKLRIVNFADTFEFIKGAENRMCNDPMDFLNYIANADYVLTDSFHGTAFSLNFCRQFLTVPAPRYNCRLESILRLTECTERMILDSNEALKKIDIPIDYEDVGKRLEGARRQSILYLMKALET